ncbi:MAG: lipopolysaccharide biosynthesis protein RfbH [Desulfuromonadaceae bacterium]
MMTPMSTGRTVLDSSRNQRVGEIVLLDFPYANQAGSKVRPGVIISQTSGNFSDLTVAYMSTEVDSYCSDEGAVILEPEDLESGVLKMRSVIRVDKLLVINGKKIKRGGVGRLSRSKLDTVLRAWSRIVVTSHFDAVHSAQKKPFTPGDRIPYAGRVFDEKEITSLVDASLDFWLTTGRYAEKFEKEFSSFLGVQHCSLTNSGSSANLLAFMALTSPKLGERRIKRGDEVITVAAAFPTTVAPIIQFGAVPVFVDVTLPTYNIDVTQLEAALSSHTKAVMVAHTLGNPFDLAAVKAFCDKHNLWLIEDNCDALGSRYQINSVWKYTGMIGHIGTSSFYPPHHMTMGEGGAVYTDDALLHRIVESFRDWGRDCWCPSGKDNTCSNRFGQQFGELPFGYDHKYVYSHFGYNLKVTDMQAAIGCAQLEKLPGFIESRKKNWKLLRDGLAGLEDKLVLPEATDHSDPSWFGFLLTVQERNGLSRDKLVGHLERKGIQTRMLFAGNLIKHPCFDEMRCEGKGYRVIGNLATTDRIMRDTFWVGVFPGMTEEMVEYMVETITYSCQ